MPAGGTGEATRLGAGDQVRGGQTAAKYVVVVPVEGSPYIHGVLPKGDDKLLRGLVDGLPEPAPQGYYGVHPLFTKNKKWDIVRQLLSVKSVQCWVNEKGMYECCPNMGLLVNPQFRLGGAPHAWGNAVLVVPAKVLEVLKVKVDDMKEECCGCGKELGKDFKEYDVLTRACGACAEEEDE